MKLLLPIKQKENTFFCILLLRIEKFTNFWGTKLRFIDLFAGIGGFRLGFERAGFECVFSSEIDKACQDVYENNFGEVPFGDITKINPVELPDFEILTAGFPCQPFSISGKKKGFEDTRGTLFFDICQIIAEKKPKILVLENVKHLIHHDSKRTFKVILDSLKYLGYNVTFEILNAKDFGLPQNRERIFIVGSLNNKFNFHLLTKKQKVVLEDFLDTTGNFELLPEEEYTLIENPKTQPTGLKFVGYRNKNQWKRGVRPDTEHLSRVHRQPNRIYSTKGTHPTIPSQETSGRFFIYDENKKYVRKLTIDECYRIMGFPDYFKRHHSIAEQYKQVGNSVAVPVIEEIAKNIIEQGLLNENDESSRNSYTSIQEFLYF
jgi:DNA (cytosine-5)-methyltransferase 1